MLEKVNLNQTLINTLMGFNRVYQNLNTDEVNGLTKDELAKLTSLTGYDLPFAQMLSNDFSKIDKNNDGTISTEEYQKLLSSFQTNGVTYEQLYNLVSQNYGIGNKSLLETVLNNFSKVDKNHDGRVTEIEMNTYLADTEIDKKKTELFDRSLDDMTIFYGGSTVDAASETDDTSSLTENTSL